MSDDDSSLDEKRVYADREGATTAFVASGAGVDALLVEAAVVVAHTDNRAAESRKRLRWVRPLVAALEPTLAPPDDILVVAEGRPHQDAVIVREEAEFVAYVPPGQGAVRKRLQQ